ncbi:MAG: hypothetical protein K6F32_01415 [Bacilli bacterium]|nr:hypothetical protein [Bacilli bacterium]
MENEEIMNPVEEVEEEVVEDLLPIPEYNGKKATKDELKETAIRVIAHKKNGDTVTVSFPISAILNFTKAKPDSAIATSKFLKNIDFKMILGMVRMGLTGPLCFVESPSGEEIEVVAERR